MLPLKYRVLEVLADAYRQSGERLLQNSKSILGAAFPEVTGAQLRSILADLKADKLINYVSDDGVKGLAVNRRARSVLNSLREEHQRKETEKHDARRWQIKSMILGYALGFLSGVGLMIVRSVLFK